MRKGSAFAGSSKDTQTAHYEIFKSIHSHFMFSLYTLYYIHKSFRTIVVIPIVIMYGIYFSSFQSLHVFA